MIPAAEALKRLKDGNRRFVERVRNRGPLLDASTRLELTQAQEPFAIVLGCSDARVPAEIIFDQGLGDLFVIRVAGNVVSPSQVGSVEFAAERYGTRLVVVMGHTKCGAVEATLEALDGGAPPSTNLMWIVERVRPALETVRAEKAAGDREGILRSAGRANVRIAVDHLRHGSAVLEKLIALEGLAVVGAEYDVETGKVDFFDEPLARPPANGNANG